MHCSSVLAGMKCSASKASAVSRERASAVQVDRKLASRDECGFDARLSGTTACLALVAGDQVATANVGDSRAMVVRSAPGNRLQAVQLTQDAKPELPGVRAPLMPGYASYCVTAVSESGGMVP